MTLSSVEHCTYRKFIDFFCERGGTMVHYLALRNTVPGAMPAASGVSNSGPTAATSLVRPSPSLFRMPPWTSSVTPSSAATLPPTPKPVAKKRVGGGKKATKKTSAAPSAACTPAAARTASPLSAARTTAMSAVAGPAGVASVMQPPTAAQPPGPTSAAVPRSYGTQVRARQTASAPALSTLVSPVDSAVAREAPYDALVPSVAQPDHPSVMVDAVAHKFLLMLLRAIQPVRSSELNSLRTELQHLNKAYERISTSMNTQGGSLERLVAAVGTLNQILQATMRSMHDLESQQPGTSRADADAGLAEGPVDSASAIPGGTGDDYDGTTETVDVNPDSIASLPAKVVAVDGAATPGVNSASVPHSIGAPQRGLDVLAAVSDRQRRMAAAARESSKAREAHEALEEAKRNTANREKVRAATKVRLISRMANAMKTRKVMVSKTENFSIMCRAVADILDLNGNDASSYLKKSRSFVRGTPEKPIIYKEKPGKALKQDLAHLLADIKTFILQTYFYESKLDYNALSKEDAKKLVDSGEYFTTLNSRKAIVWALMVFCRRMGASHRVVYPDGRPRRFYVNFFMGPFVMESSMVRNELMVTSEMRSKKRSGKDQACTPTGAPS